MDVVEATYSYSRLLWWELENFMSIPYGRCEFDENNIINIKGYNDSGKSALLIGLDVLLNNRYPQQQASFIQDNKTYFKCRGYFDDDVTIVKYKYISGQSLYEMYKGQELIYTTAGEDGKPTRVLEMPSIIEEYLGMIHFKDIFLNVRRCFEKQLLVETTGSENYKFLHGVLHCEELSRAVVHMTTDRNALVNEVSTLGTEIVLLQSQTKGLDGVTQELIDTMKVTDKNIDINEVRVTNINEMLEYKEKIDSTVIYPTVPTVDLSRLESIDELLVLHKKSEVLVPPTIPTVDTSRLATLELIEQLIAKQKSIKVMPKVDLVDTERLREISHIEELNDNLHKVKIPSKLEYIDTERIQKLNNILELETEINRCKAELIALKEKQTQCHSSLDKLHKDMQNKGIKIVKCKSCGTLMEVS